MIALILVLLVIALHLYFMLLEIVLWIKPLGLKTFGNTPEFAQASALLAMNMGLYNGFLAAGLAWGLVENRNGWLLEVFFLSCVILAGLFGAYTVNKRILFVQALPAALALAALFLDI